MTSDTFPATNNNTLNATTASDSKLQETSLKAPIGRTHRSRSVTPMRFNKHVAATVATPAITLTSTTSIASTSAAHPRSTSNPSKRNNSVAPQKQV
uniref:Uncharacterized protein n=1 Tax=Panagrellus redivivus TaxID=6233 RepID=A0A7E4V1C6_PANRE